MLGLHGDGTRPPCPARPGLAPPRPAALPLFLKLNMQMESTVTVGQARFCSEWWRQGRVGWGGKVGRDTDIKQLHWSHCGAEIGRASSLVGVGEGTAV